MSESKQNQHPLRRFTTKKFLRRRTTTDVVEKLTPSSKSAPVSAPSSTTTPVSEPSSTGVSTPRSRIPSPAASSRCHAFSSRLNAPFTPPDSLRSQSQIPRSTTQRPACEFLDAVGVDPTVSQDSHYPSFSTPNQGRSDVEANQRPFLSWHKPIHRTDTVGIIMPPRFMSPPLSTTTRSNERGIAEHDTHMPNLCWPLSPLTQPDRDDDETPTMRQFTNLDNPTGIIDSPTLTVQTIENITSHSPPVSQYRANSDLPEESSADTSGLASPMSPNPDQGDYSVDVSDESIGLALTTPIPSGGDIIYETATEVPEPFNFVMPERPSKTQDYWPPKSSTENTKESGIEDRISPQMNEEDLSALLISTAQPTGYWLGRLTALSDRFRTEAMASHSHTSSFKLSGIDPDSMHDDRRRILGIFMYLHALCSTQAAKDSLEEFRILYMKKVLKDVGPLGSGKKVREKKGVFEKLMGKKGVGK